MTYTQRDGFPLTFNLITAARMAGVSVPTLRNYVARDHLKHVGQIPLAGQERRFTAAGLIEIALMGELTDAGHSVNVAAAITKQLFDDACEAAMLTTEVKPLAGYTMSFETYAEYFDMNPGELMTGPWASRDLSNPQIVVFFVHGNKFADLAIANGWLDIENAKSKAIQPVQGSNGVVMGILNLTAVLCKVDRGIEALSLPAEIRPLR